MPSFECRHLRRTILNMAYSGQTVHIGCAFSLVEVMAVLYREHLRYRSDDPHWSGRDYLVLSKGHGVMAVYACLHEIGWLSDTDIARYFKDGTKLKGLSDAHVPGLEVTSGSLGHGLSVGVGLAMAAKRRGTDQRVYAIVGDGEMNEGSCWEALLFATQFRLSNLITIVDANGYQAMGSTREVMDMDPWTDKFRAFGQEVREVDGHDETAIHEALQELEALPSDRPRALIARTVKGHGVSFMAGDNRWHYTRLTADTHRQAVAELS